MVSSLKIPSTIRVIIDVDPYTFMWFIHNLGLNKQINIFDA
jgi:hypothetical protein